MKKLNMAIKTALLSGVALTASIASASDQALLNTLLEIRSFKPGPVRLA